VRWWPIALLGLARRLSGRAGVFREIYYTAGFSEPFEVYVGRWLLFYLVSAPLVAALAFALHSAAGYPPLPAAVLSLLVTVIFTLLALLAALYYPLYRRYSLSVSIESRLPYTLAYFAALASSGMGLEGILERVAEVEESPATRRELELLLTEVRLLGVDMLTALERRARMSPSVVLSLFLTGLRDAYIAAGDLYEYSAFVARRLLELKRQELRRVLNSVALVAEAYVTLMVAAPLIFIVMLALISMLGGSVGGLPPQLVIAIVTLVGMPASAAATIVMLDGILSRV